MRAGPGAGTHRWATTRIGQEDGRTDQPGRPHELAVGIISQEIARRSHQVEDGRHDQQERHHPPQRTARDCGPRSRPRSGSTSSMGTGPTRVTSAVAGSDIRSSSSGSGGIMIGRRAGTGPIGCWSNIAMNILPAIAAEPSMVRVAIGSQNGSGVPALAAGGEHRSRPRPPLVERPLVLGEGPSEGTPGRGHRCFAQLQRPRGRERAAGRVRPGGHRPGHVRLAVRRVRRPGRARRRESASCWSTASSPTWTRWVCAAPSWPRPMPTACTRSTVSSPLQNRAAGWGGEPSRSPRSVRLPRVPPRDRHCGGQPRRAARCR